VVQQATATYSTSLSVGGLAGATLSVPMLALVGWRGTFVAWALPALLAGALWLSLAPGRATAHVPETHGLGRLARRGSVWHVAALFGSQSLAYYGAATWIPFLLRGTPPAYLALVLLVFNLATLPPGIVLAPVRRPWATSRAFYAGAGLAMLAGALGLVAAPVWLAWLAAALLGAGVGMTFSGTTALPTVLASSGTEVASYSAIVLTAGYALAFVGPLIGGVLLDLTGIVRAPFWTIAVAAAAMLALGATLPASARGRPDAALPAP
jgi:CP family cyanate transporter-like MFS transporter